MSFTGQLPPPVEKTIDEPGVMRIGGPGGRRFREVLRWLAVIVVVGAAMVGLLIRFGATTLWAFGLVGFMLGYMGLMGRWASGNDRR
jgi:hypothetical protein